MGLYCEQSLQGKKLVNLERRLLKEEWREFSGSNFSFESLQRFRKQNQTFQELNSFFKENHGIYESFAVFTEFLLSKEFGLRTIFERKYDSLTKHDKEAIEELISFSQNYGNLATFYNFGLARRTTPKRIRRLLKEVYKDKL